MQLKVYNIYVVENLVAHPPLPKYSINLALFIFPSVCNAKSPDHQFSLIFFHELRHHKVR